jgi:hypothetical protein
MTGRNDQYPITYLAPHYRSAPLAAEFAACLAEHLSWMPNDFGSGYAWETEVPPREDWEREAVALEAHLASLED